MGYYDDPRYDIPPIPQRPQMDPYASYQQGNTAQSVGRLSNQAGDATMASSMGNPYALAAGGALKAAGTVADIYGSYQAWKDAERQQEEAKRRQVVQDQIDAKQRQQAEEDRYRHMLGAGAQYAQGIQGDERDRYAGYYRSVGY